MTTSTEVPTVHEPVWVDAWPPPDLGRVRSSEPRRRTLPVRFGSLAVILVVTVVLWSMVNPLPGPTMPEFADDTGGAVYLLTSDDGAFQPWTPGEIVTVSSNRLLSSDVDEGAGTRPIDFVVADPWERGGNHFTYVTDNPSQSIRLAYNTYTTFDGVDIHVLTTSSTDPEAAITPVGSRVEPREIRIRGVRGWVVADASSNAANPVVSVSWQITPTHIAKVVGATSTNEIRAIAESLYRASLNDWITDRAFLVEHFDAQMAQWQCLTSQGVDLADPPEFDEYVRREAIGRAWFLFEGVAMNDLFRDAMDVCT